MASSDVIELGSSDDEAEPVPKKKKPTPNAMVHFPNEVPGLVIKPVKPALPNLQKVLAGGAVTITNVKNCKSTTLVNKVKPNSRSVKKFVQRPPLKIPIAKNISVTNSLTVNNLSVNPLSFMKKQLNERVQVPKLSLPPGITVKRTATGQNISPLMGCHNRKKINFKRKQPAKIITTVELDDEEAPLASGTSPQWYLRPEEQTQISVEKKEEEIQDKESNTDNADNMELENNKEPDTRKYIEITIEDSPIKPLQIRQGFEVGSELPITIEDSPIKLLKSADDQICASDSEAEKSNTTEPQSKKRLDYPKNDDDLVNTEGQKIVEIDLDIVPSTDRGQVTDKEDTGAVVADELEKKDEVQKEQLQLETTTTSSPTRSVQTVLITSEVKDVEVSEKLTTRQNSESGEFHPIYQKFIDLCFELENSDDMTKIVEKKIKTYYRQCPKDYVESEDFIDMVSSKIFTMKAAPDKMYLYIKDIVDELNLQRKSAKAVEVTNKENKKAEDDKYFVADDGEYDSKRSRQIRKLDKTIKKLHRAIQKLEEQEVEFEDEEDSVYLLTERYKERLIRVHAKFCQLTNTKMPSEPRIQIESRPGLPLGPAKRLEKWVNKKVPIGTPLPFPDFHDVLRCVREANEEDRLGWNEADIMQEARDLFTRCGKKLQRRRQENEWRIAAARISHDVSTLDPAEKSDDLKKKLEENKTIAAKKEIELLNKYADKQNQLKLVGEEIGDKEAEESPLESEDDETNDESNSLEDKQKRKERLKRLLHEKTRKLSSEKENTCNEVTVNKDETKVLVDEDKITHDAILDEAETKEVDRGDVQEVINKLELICNNNTGGISPDIPNNEQKKERTNDFDLYDVDSDIDELHLLQKLYSENEIHSSTQESDSDSPIAISDTLDSNSDNENSKTRHGDDIISIENSSYSESEVTKDEYESARTSEGQEKTIEGLLFQNTEVMLLSLKKKLEVEEENILLASSDEENNLDIQMPVDSDKALLTDGSGNNDSELVLENCPNSDLENDKVTYEVPLNEGAQDKIDEATTQSNSGVFYNNQHKIELKKVRSVQSNIQLDNNVELIKSKNILDSINENQGDFTVKNNDVPLVNKDPCNKVNCISNEVFSQTKNSSEIILYKSKENVDKNVSLNNESNNDKLNTTAVKEISNEHHKDISEDYKLCPEPNILSGNGESASNNVSTNCINQDFNECEVMDVDVKIAGDSSPLTNKKTTCEDVEIATSVQCK